MDVDQIGNGAGLETIDRVAEGVVVAFVHPGVFSLGAANFRGVEVISGEVDNRHADVSEDVGIG